MLLELPNTLSLADNFSHLRDPPNWDTIMAVGLDHRTPYSLLHIGELRTGELMVQLHVQLRLPDK